MCRLTLQDSSILSSLEELLSLAKAQQREIHDLRQQLNLQQQKMTTVAHEVQVVEEKVSKRLESTLAEFSKEECILNALLL